MATQSMIALKTDAGYECVYVHNDGHTESVGQALLDSFNTNELAVSLVALGDLSSVARKSNIDEVIAYHRDRGNNWDDVHPQLCKTLIEAMDLYNPYFTYIWDGETWTAYKGSDKLAWNN